MHNSTPAAVSADRTPVTVFGAGGHAKVVVDAIRRNTQLQVVGLFDDDARRRGEIFCGLPIVGGREALAQFHRDHPDCRFVVAVGDCRTRQAMQQAFVADGCVPVAVVHPHASVAESTVVEPGAVVFAQAVVGPDAVVGSGAIVNSGAVVEHDCVLEPFVHVAPRATVCGGVRVGEGSLVGAGAVVLPGRKIGNGATVGAGATIVVDVADGATVVGTPAKSIARRTPTPAVTNDRAWSPWPSFADDEIEAATRVLRSGKVNYWTGDECRKFEAEFAVSVGRRHAIALANGTLALELALHTLGIGDGDEIVTSPRTFIASASCAVMRGARPVFADVDLDSQNITAESIARVLSPRTRAVIVVHLAGRPCDMDPILELARRRNLKVVEDCAQAQGAVYRGRPIGSFGDFAAFSFCQDKIMTTGGEGGMLVTDDQDLWNRAWSYKDHGKDYDVVYHRRHELGFRWLHESFGTNWRMTEMQGAMGRVQLPKVAGWVRRRRMNAARLSEYLRGIAALRVPEVPGDTDHAFYKLYAFVEPEHLRAGWTRDRIMGEIVAAGVPCYTGTCGEAYLEGAFRNSDLAPAERLPNARRLAETSLMFPVHPTLTDAEIERIGAVARRILLEASNDAACIPATDRAQAA